MGPGWFQSSAIAATEARKALLVHHQLVRGRSGRTSTEPEHEACQPEMRNESTGNVLLSGTCSRTALPVLPAKPPRPVAGVNLVPNAHLGR